MSTFPIRNQSLRHRCQSLHHGCQSLRHRCQRHWEDVLAGKILWMMSTFRLRTVKFIGPGWVVTSVKHTITCADLVSTHVQTYFQHGSLSWNTCADISGCTEFEATHRKKRSVCIYLYDMKCSHTIGVWAQGLLFLVNLNLYLFTFLLLFLFFSAPHLCLF